MGLTALPPFLAQLLQQQPQLPQDGSAPQAPSQQNLPSLPDVTNVQPGMPPQAKGHKLMQILQNGLRGALDGYAQNAQTYAQTGRNAGFGGGVQGAVQMPFLRQYQQGQLAQQQAGTQETQAQTELIKQQGQNVTMPGYGSMPAGLAKVLFPALIKGQTAENVQTKKSQTAENVAGINKRFMAVPGVGLFDTQTRQVMPGSEQGITLTQQHLEDYGLPKEFLGKQMTIPQLAALERAQNQQTVVAQGSAGPSLVNKKTAQTTPLGLGAPSLGGIQEVGDLNNPGNTTFTTKGQAIASAAQGPQSASVQVPRQAAKAEVPTKIGDQKVAFTTMIQHADLLRRAAKALNNGDMQTLSGLENAFKNEFGYSGPITSAAIADAYKGEVSNVINKGHITDTGNEKIAHTLDPTKQNYQTIDSVLGAYQALAQSKMNMLTQQKNAAVSASQPKKPNAKVNDPLGLR